MLDLNLGAEQQTVAPLRPPDPLGITFALAGFLLPHSPAPRPPESGLWPARRYPLLLPILKTDPASSVAFRVSFGGFEVFKYAFITNVPWNGLAKFMESKNYE